MSKEEALINYYMEEEMANILGRTIGSLRTEHTRRSNKVPPKTNMASKNIYYKTSFQEWLRSKEVRISFDSRGRRCR